MFVRRAGPQRKLKSDCMHELSFALSLRKVKGACEILGLDTLYVANEGKLVAVVSDDLAPTLVERMKRNEYGQGRASLVR